MAMKNSRKVVDNTDHEINYDLTKPEHVAAFRLNNQERIVFFQNYLKIKEGKYFDDNFRSKDVSYKYYIDDNL